VGKITKYISNTSFLEKAFSYLKSNHRICAVLVDKNGKPELLSDEPTREFPISRFYAVDFEMDVGGIRCSAETEAALEAAEPHVRICIEGLQEILIKDWVLKQTTDEMLKLSSQLHFLFNLAKKVSGIQRARDYCAVVLREIEQTLHADCAMVHIKGAQPDKDLLLWHGMEETKACRYRQNSIFHSLPKSTVLLSLEDGTSALVSPIHEKETPVGCMAFFKSPEKRFFSSYEKKFLGIIEDIISPTVESLRLYDSLHDLYMNTVKALAAAIDAKDAYTHGHSFRVAKYATSIGRQLGISEEKLTDLEVAAYMHDLGKIGISEAILGKPGRLTSAEFEEVKKHPLITDKILEAIDLPQHIVDAAVQHHERLDGRGYPLGLEGESISSYARIIAVADVFDALTTTRFYRDAMTVEDALTILCQGIDAEYDRRVVGALVWALQNKKEDREMAQLYPDLKFLDIGRMNHFLKDLTKLLLAGDSRPDYPVPAALSAISAPLHPAAASDSNS
jgi:HD-GYP domain-containing protein (c-di-GMP phosphodiesterase class II)